MGLILQVGKATSVYGRGEGAEVERLLKSELGFRPAGLGLRTYASDEMGASWIERLQKVATKRLGRKACPHLLACDSWNTVYLPAKLAPRVLELGEAGPPSFGVFVMGQDGEIARELEGLAEHLNAKAAQMADELPGNELVCASLPALSEELRRFGEKAKLPVDASDLKRERQAIRKARSEPDPVLAAYVELSIAAALATQRKMPLWVVK